MSCLSKDVYRLFGLNTALNNLKRVVLPVRFLFCSFLLFLPSVSYSSNLQYFSFDAPSMGTSYRLTVAAHSYEQAQALFVESQSYLTKMEEVWSPWIEGSEVWRINHAGSESIDLSRETFSLIEQSIRMSELTQGAFDITFAAVGHLYNYRESVRPSQARLDKTLEFISHEHLHLDSKNKRLRKQSNNIRIDLGGIAKGAAIEKLTQFLISKGIRSAYLSLGGDSYLLGKKGEYSWMLGVKHPRESGKVIARIPLEDVAVSTSGDYERFFMDEGERVHHILSPVTGTSVSEVMSVTVIGEEAWKTDALSTSVFVMGSKKGLALIETIPDYDVIIIDRSGAVIASSGLLNPNSD